MVTRRVRNKIKQTLKENMQKIQEYTYEGKGLTRVFENEKWMVGIKNWKPENDITGLTCLERHNITDELFILHGTKDEVVSFDAVKAFAEDNVIEFEPIENADHRFQSPEKMDLAIAKICAFFGLR